MELVFLDEKENAIVVNGELFIFRHEEDVSIP